MSDQNTIARPEIAALLKISVTTPVNAIRYSDAQVPEPLRLEGRMRVYDREIMLAWIATNPLAHIKCQQQAKKSETAKRAEEQTADHIHAFLSGAMGLSKAQRHRNQLRKVAAKHRPRKTQRIEVSGSDAYNGTRDAWAGLV